MLDDVKSAAYLEVDGGISAENLPQLIRAGANVFVTAHAVFSHPEGIGAGVQALRLAAEQVGDTRARSV